MPTADRHTSGFGVPGADEAAARPVHCPPPSFSEDETRRRADLSHADVENRRLRRRLAKIISRNGELERFVRELKAEVSSGRAGRTQLTSRNEALEQERARLIDEVARARAEVRRDLETLEQIYGSLAWRLVRAYAAMRDHVLPHGTHRRRHYERMRDVVKGVVRQRSLLDVPGPRDMLLQLALDELTEPDDLKANLRAWLANTTQRLAVPVCSTPDVSIIVPTFNRAEYLYQNVVSIVSHSDASYELIVVDDGSTDETTLLLSRIDGVRVVKHPRRLDFIAACNDGAAASRGRHLLFLNNDTEVPPQWLSTLLSTLECRPDCAVVGPRLVHERGTLQECGSIVWRDGSAAAYGRGDDRHRPEYGYAREVDYCSGACLLVRGDVFRALGGFDEAYSPAYYEDVDLCFGVRSLGYAVVVDPRVSVVHREYGSRPAAEARSLMAANRERFERKHRVSLANQREAGDVLRARDRRTGPRVMFFDDQVPAPHLGSGFPRTRQLLRMLAELGFILTFKATTGCTPDPSVTSELQQLGVEVLAGDSPDSERLLRDRSGYYDIVVVSRPHNGSRLLPAIRATQPNARVIYDAEALYFERETLRSIAAGRPLTSDERQRLAKRELGLTRDADAVITVCETERATICRETGHTNVEVWGLPQTVRKPHVDSRCRRDLLFIGGFAGAHPPNCDAVFRLSNDLMPKLRGSLPGCRLFIVGSQPSVEISRLNSLGIVVTGTVNELETYYDACRVFVAPIRFGAGISCKVIGAMGNGLPSVVTPIVAKGLGLVHERETLIGGSDSEFVSQVIRLYEDEELWRRIQHNAAVYVHRNCSPIAMRDALLRIMTVGGRSAPPQLSAERFVQPHSSHQ